MISARAQHALEEVFVLSVKNSIAQNAGDTVHVNSLGCLPQLHAKQKFMQVLTISSCMFRTMLVFYVADNADMHGYFGKGGQQIEDVFAEIVNLCGGEFNRHMGNQFDYLGMSTPYTLKTSSAHYLQSLNPTLLTSYDITVNGGVGLQASLCVTANTPLDFAIDLSSAEQVAGGELELF